MGLPRATRGVAPQECQARGEALGCQGRTTRKRGDLAVKTVSINNLILLGRDRAFSRGFFTHPDEARRAYESTAMKAGLVSVLGVRKTWWGHPHREVFSVTATPAAVSESMQGLLSAVQRINITRSGLEV
jgi:hypothetical protein